MAENNVSVARGDKRFLLIKAWGFGFWSDMNHVFGCLLLADMEGRIPVTHWGRNSLFTDGNCLDGFQLYFEPVSPHTLEDLERIPESSVFPRKWTGSNLRRENFSKWSGADSRLVPFAYIGRRETIAVSDFYMHVPDLLPRIPPNHPWHGNSVGEVYRLIAAKYLRLRPHIAAAVDDFYRKRMAGTQPIIAVHVRGTDKFIERDYSLDLKSYFELIDREPRDWRIFLLTDQKQYVDAFVDRYGSRAIFTDAMRSDSKFGAHHNPMANRERLGIDILTDTFLAMRCDKFIGHGLSNPACMISMLKDWRDGSCILLGESLLHRSFINRMRPKNNSPLEPIRGAFDRWRERSSGVAPAAPFGNQRARMALFLALINQIRPVVIVETGSRRGDTTEFMLRATAVPIFAIEQQARNYGYTRARFLRSRRVFPQHGDSRPILTKLLAGALQPFAQKTVFAYLGAHGHKNDVPLPDEIDLIISQCPAAVIMAADFQVPCDSDYSFDRNAAGRGRTLALIAPEIEKHSLCAFYPSAPGAAETGKRGGCIVLVKEPYAHLLASMPELCQC